MKALKHFCFLILATTQSCALENSQNQNAVENLQNLTNEQPIQSDSSKNLLQPKPNHCDKVTSENWEYCYLTNNCHTAANAGVEERPGITGIVKCGGNPENGDLGHHTFNYRVACKFDLVKCPGKPDKKKFHSCATVFLIEEKNVRETL